MGNYNKASYQEPAFGVVAADSQGLDVENRVSKRPRVQFGEPFSKELEPDLQFSPAFNANVRHTLFDSLAPVHVLGAA